MAVLLVLAGVLAAGLVHMGAAASRRASAEAAADAVALAGAADGVEAARRTAADNDARLVSYRVVGSDVVATVERRGVFAAARARWQVEPASGEARRSHGGPSPRADASRPPHPR